MSRHPLKQTILLLLALGCGGDQRQTTASGGRQAGGVAVYCAVNTADALNAFVSSDETATDLQPLLYTPLVQYDSVGSFRPALAQSWTWSDDHQSLLFKLRNDVRWHDGKPVTAADVAWTITAAADSTYPYWRRGDIADIDSVRPVGSDVEIRFRRAFAPGLEPFVRIPILPKHLLESIPASSFRNAPYHQQPIGSGPFKFAGKLPDGSVKLDRVAEYPADLGTALLDRIVLREVPDASAILVELQTGGADVCAVGSSIAAQAENAGSRILPVVPVGALIVALDNRKPPFTDVRVRRALSAALNRTEIAAVVSRAARPSRNFLPDQSVRWRDTTIVQPDSDLSLANALLDSAGWNARAQDGTRQNSRGERLRFTITAPATLQNILTVVQSQLRRAGADVQLRMLEPSAFFGLLGDPSRRPVAAAVIFTPDRIAIPDALPLFHSRGDMNIASYSNTKVDSILERLQTVIPDEERARAYHDIERYIATDVPVIYTVQTPRMLAVRPRVHDVRVDANGPFTNASQWNIPANERQR